MRFKSIKLLGFVLNENLAKRGVSSTLGFLCTHLRSRGRVARILDVKLREMQDKLYLLRNLGLGKQVTSFRFAMDVGRREKMSSVAGELVRKLDRRVAFNAVLQVGSMFKLHHIGALSGVPRFSYHDNNTLAYLKSAHGIRGASRYVGRAARFEKEIYERLDAIFTMTEFLRRSFIEDFGVQPEKVHNIGFGANLPTMDGFDKKYDGKTVLFVAKDSFREKGGEVVLQAFRRVREEIKNAELLIVGQKPRTDATGVRSIGFVDKRTVNGEKRMTELYRKASLFVMPSFVEAAGSVFLEAMANKTPCIGANVSAMPEIIVGNGCGEVVNPGDVKQLASKMVQLLSDEEKLRQYGENGFRAVQEKYNWDAVCQKFEDVVMRFI